MATVTFDPCLTLNGSGLNLKFWMVMLSLAPAAVVVAGPPPVVAGDDGALVVVDDLLPDEPHPTAPRASTATATTRAGRETVDTGTSGHPAGRTASNTSCCGDRRTAGG